MEELEKIIGGADYSCLCLVASAGCDSLEYSRAGGTEYTCACPAVGYGAYDGGGCVCVVGGGDNDMVKNGATKPSGC